MPSERRRDGSTETDPPVSLEKYDSAALGPLFAVSDEGSAAQALVDAAYASAKAASHPGLDPLTLGVVLDGERMTSAGEVPIGPEEYEVLLAGAKGRLHCTTNVGVRVNTRLTQLLPEFAVHDLSRDPRGYDAVFEAFAPFLHTPDGKPRPLNIRLVLRPDDDVRALQPVVEALESGRRQGKIGPPEAHRFSVLILFEDAIVSEAQIQTIRRVIDAAASAGLTEVAVDGELLDPARKRLAMQALLNVVERERLRELLKYSHEAGVRLTYRYQLDVPSAARTIWTGLYTAMKKGFAAGKYGMVPMTLEEQRTAIELLTAWCEGWTAIPAFYVDTPLVTADDVFYGSRVAEAARLWLKTARGAGATLVLFDCPDRVTPRRMIKGEGGTNDVGILSLDEVQAILEYARILGVRILWSGGITAQQAFDLASRRVFGIFSTSSTATKIAVTAQFDSDPRLPAENEPTEFGVRRIHALIQAGFLSTAVADIDSDLASSISRRARDLLGVGQDASASESALDSLDSELGRGWRKMPWNSTQSRPRGNATYRAPHPVPADAVRVFRGMRRVELGHEELVSKLETVFMPTTVQMQRLYGLTAYLPAVLPPDHGEGVPDEVALVFYRTQNAYHEAKRCVGGRCYSELHELVFDMKRSKSSFPKLFESNVDEDQPYHLFETSVDWQLGASRLYVGRVHSGMTASAVSELLAQKAASLRRSPSGIDGAIFCLAGGVLMWWDHSAEALTASDVFGDVADTVFSGSPRIARVPTSLTFPYLGVTLRSSGDFLNIQFLRRLE